MATLKDYRDERLRKLEELKKQQQQQQQQQAGPQNSAQNQSQTQNQQTQPQTQTSSRQVPWIRLSSADPLAARDSLVLAALDSAVHSLTGRLGPDISTWQYGRIHHALLYHILSPAVNDATRAKLDVGPLPRGGYGVTVNATGNGENQTAGASFRIIVDTGDWDRTVGSNTPGQSGDPDSPHYRDLFAMWANNRYFPAYFSRARVEAVTEQRLELTPGR